MSIEESELVKIQFNMKMERSNGCRKCYMCRQPIRKYEYCISWFEIPTSFQARRWGGYRKRNLCLACSDTTLKTNMHDIKRLQSQVQYRIKNIERMKKVLSKQS